MWKVYQEETIESLIIFKKDSNYCGGMKFNEVEIRTQKNMGGRGGLFLGSKKVNK